MWLRRPAHAAWLFSALREISPIASSCLRFTILPQGVFCRMPSRSSELRAARCPTTPSAATWRKLCVDLPSAASTSGRQAGCSPAPPMSTATPPSAFAPISRHLGRSGIAREEDGAWRRLIVEKPFGTDLASAQALNRELLGLLEEHQIYRIDHYLGKETVQNILVLRFANGLFEPIWNRDHIDHVQITVAETLTVGRRGRFYDATGALRDMVPNHLFQLLSLVAMEPPSRFEAHA